MYNPPASIQFQATKRQNIGDRLARGLTVFLFYMTTRYSYRDFHQSVYYFTGLNSTT